MGNCFGRRRNPVVQTKQFAGERKVQIKVRMTVGELKEVLARADLSNGGTYLGHLIVQDCLEGEHSGRIVPVVDESGDRPNERSLDTIAEEDE